jgi:hypothetical protein
VYQKGQGQFIPLKVMPRWPTSSNQGPSPIGHSTCGLDEPTDDVRVLVIATIWGPGPQHMRLFRGHFISKPQPMLSVFWVFIIVTGLCSRITLFPSDVLVSLLMELPPHVVFGDACSYCTPNFKLGCLCFYCGTSGALCVLGTAFLFQICS